MTAAASEQIKIMQREDAKENQRERKRQKKCMHVKHRIYVIRSLK